MDIHRRSMELRGRHKVMNLHTATPWYVTLFEEYNEIHIQSASKDYDNHVFSIHYGNPDGLTEAMANAKLIVESVNESTGCDKLLINQQLFDEVGI